MPAPGLKRWVGPLVLSGLAVAATAGQAPGEWLQWRRDAQRTGYSPAAGRIVAPAIVGQAELGGVEDWLVLTPAAVGEAPVELPARLQPFDRAAARREWGLDRWLDIEGTGEPEPVQERSRERYFQLDPNETRYDRVLFESTREKTMPATDTQRGWRERRVDGQWQRLWTSEPDTVYEQPMVIRADADGDGREDVVVTVHYRIMAFDVETGEKIRELRYSNYRNYGEVHAADLNGDGRPDFVQLVKFPAHLEVILNTAEGFEVAWFEDVMRGRITDTENSLRTPFNPIVDVDGDGRLDVVYVRYNQRGDGEWHTLVLDALTGETKHEIPGFVAREIVNMGPDGRAWIFGTRSDGRFIPLRGGAAMHEIRDGEARLVWEAAELGWCDWLPNPWHDARSASIYPKSRLAVSAETGLGWLHRAGTDGVEQLVLYRFAGDEGREVGAAGLPGGEAVAFREQTGELLVRTTRPKADFNGQAWGLASRLVGTEELAGRVDAPVVFREADGAPRVVVPDLLGGVMCLDLAQPDAPRTIWRRPGLGMGSGRGAVVARGEGDVRFPTFIEADARGAARVVQVDSAGETRWTVELPRTPARLNMEEEQGGIAQLMALPLQSAGVDDLAVTGLQSNLHSGFTIALDGRNGEQLWRQERSGRVGVHNAEGVLEVEARGYGGNWPFAGLPKADGTEDLVSAFPDIIYTADGRTGEFTLHHCTQFGTFMDYDAQGDVYRNKASFYAIPIVLPEGVIYGGCPYVTGLWRVEDAFAGFQWRTAYHAPLYHRFPRPMQVAASLGEDGRRQLIGWEYAKGMLTCRDLLEGDLRWTLAIAEGDAGDSFVGCDLDGDGRDEVLLCTPQELVAVGEREGAGAILWRLALAAPCHEPVVADVDGDGAAEILLPCDDGRLYVVGNQGSGQ
ncbi:MAG TPA: VCBS repeat-containing protein [Candidatus Sumerlaeota bacterium]|nr:VCBS repeat-containing protein [Candidatus Sumerlaeota bacterium]